MNQLEIIQKRIYTIRGMQVMLDRDLAEFYQVKAIRLREQVKRNKNRFPLDFMFCLTEGEVADMVSQKAIPSRMHLGGALPYAFTEQGVAMLSAVLKSETAVRVSIQIMNAFVAMRRFISSHGQVLPRLENLEKQQLKHEIESEQKFERVFTALESRDIHPKQGIFFNGQIFDADQFVSDIIRKAKKAIILIDNYVDDSVLLLLSKRRKNVSAVILTRKISPLLRLDVEKHNAQYGPIEIRIFKHAHDRFLIIDENEVYHIGASLKDLGKKWFAFSRLDKEVLSIMEKIK